MVRRTKEDAIATRNGLIDAAEKVFYDKGVSRASLSDIALAAGTTRGAIYWHFKDKVDLFNAMMDRVTLPLEQGYGEFEASVCPDPLQRLRAVMALVLESVASDERTRRVFEIAMHKVEYVGELVAVRERHLAASDGFIRQLARDFELAAQAQHAAMPVSPMGAAMGLHALFDGLIQNWILSNGVFDLVGIGRVCTDAFISGLGLRLGVPAPAADRP
ncbi:TetR family transcriptional regulator [Acidovorax sp. LjRoot118]|uniref:TetR family transcriptional regulator n=1 Tax=unclassified Acidovorax TaxID=2684926 RepID=UPI0007089E88|nr:TetR family transcriptional regulator [Acidovorax sp. Root219]KRC31390.1 TetR family transcriptional regulator [Acidovorax sp. Root219]